ncbi:MAG: hypothetical protein L6R00_20835 [Phycisphaerae bacterium]|nr:hypothetical protein [Phycisphaerae bacterium]
MTPDVYRFELEQSVPIAQAEASELLTKSSLSHQQAQLIELMQRINYGRIEGLSVRCGKPTLDPLPRIVREIKFGADNGPRPEVGKTDFALKGQVRDFFAQLEAAGDGVIRCIEIQRGLPFRMTVEGMCA